MYEYGESMCYFLYGSINKEINRNDYKEAIQNSEYYFNMGSKDDVNSCVQRDGFEYRITSNICDCDTPVGSKQINEGLEELSKLLINLKAIRGIKYITISKNWVNETNEKEAIVHIEDINVTQYLANIEERTLYKIELYKKYY